MLDLLERFTETNRKGDKVFIKPQNVLKAMKIDKEYRNGILFKNHTKNTLKNYRYEKNKLIWKV